MRAPRRYPILPATLLLVSTLLAGCGGCAGSAAGGVVQERHFHWTWREPPPSVGIEQTYRPELRGDTLVMSARRVGRALALDPASGAVLDSSVRLTDSADEQSFYRDDTPSFRALSWYGTGRILEVVGRERSAARIPDFITQVSLLTVYGVPVPDTFDFDLVQVIWEHPRTEGFTPGAHFLRLRPRGGRHTATLEFPWGSGDGPWWARPYGRSKLLVSWRESPNWYVGLLDLRSVYLSARAWDEREGEE